MDKLLSFFTTDSDTLLDFLKTLLITLVFLLIFVNVINVIFKKAEKRAESSGHSSGYIRLLRYGILALIYIAAFSEIITAIPALSNFLKTLLAGSGIAAIILSVAAQEPIGNLVSGLLIVFTQPFKVGDIIRYVSQDISGVVEEITLRHTIIRTFENKRLIIPNNTFNTSTIENANYSDSKICMMIDFGITYESDAVLAMQIISDVVLLHPNFCDTRSEEDIENGVPPVTTAVINFADSAVIIRAWVWAPSTSVSISMKSDILLGIQMRFAEAGIEFAYPHTEIIIDKDKEKSK